MLRKILSFCYCLLIAIGPLLFLSLPVLASPSSKPSPRANLGSSLSENNSTSRFNATSRDVVKIVETEIWDGSKWQPAQWMDSSGEEAVPSPEDTRLPVKASKWTSGWKIVVGESKDGWKYTWKRPHQGIRERTWLRAYQVKAPAKNKKKLSKKANKDALTSSVESDDSLVIHEGPYFELPHWMQAVRDDFNFKGCGWTFYKSLLSTKSAGVAFRFPITFNFDTFDRNPQFPSCSGSIAVYNNPWCIGLFLSVSFRLEFLQWLSRRIAEQTAAAILWIVWILLVRNVGMCVSLITYPITHEWKQFDIFPEYVSKMWTHGAVEKPRYSRTVEERLGWSASWRITQGKGYEFRRSCWHSVAPTLTSLWEESFFGKLFLGNMEPPAWFLRRSAAVGFSTAAPTPNTPYFSSNIILSLSGYYLKHRGISSRRDGSMSPIWRFLPFLNKAEIQEQDSESEAEEEECSVIELD